MVGDVGDVGDVCVGVSVFGCVGGVDRRCNSEFQEITDSPGAVYKHVISNRRRTEVYKPMCKSGSVIVCSLTSFASLDRVSPPKSPIQTLLL